MKSNKTSWHSLKNNTGLGAITSSTSFHHRVILKDRQRDNSMRSTEHCSINNAMVLHPFSPASNAVRLLDDCSHACGKRGNLNAFFASSGEVTVSYDVLNRVELRRLCCRTYDTFFSRVRRSFTASIFIMTDDGDDDDDDNNARLR